MAEIMMNTLVYIRNQNNSIPYILPCAFSFSIQHCWNRRKGKW